MKKLEHTADEAIKVKNFILKLAQDTSRGEDEITLAIVEQLKGLEKSSYFPNIIHLIDTEHPNKIIERLSRQTKERLEKATTLYTEYAQSKN